MKTRLVFLLAALLVLLGRVPPALAQGTAFTYQSRLNDNGHPAGGVYVLKFTIYDSMSNGSDVAGPTTALKRGGCPFLIAFHG